MPEAPLHSDLALKDLTLGLDDDGIGVVTLDMPGRPFNVFSDAMLDEFDTLLEHLVQHAGKLRGVVFTSAKSAFMAGADLAMVEGFTSLRRRAPAAEIRRIFSRLSYLMRRLERLPMVTVAAVNGLALGGGLELAMACHHRVAAASEVPGLGLPEVLLGLLPGAGGTQRLPRLTSPAFAARMLLDGKPVTPATALAAGLLDEVVEQEQLLATARSFAATRVAGARWDDPAWQAPLDHEGILRGADAEARLCELGWADRRVRHCYPAFRAIARCLLDGFARPFDDAMEVEFDNFLQLMLDPVAGNMVRTGFLAKTAAPKRALERIGGADLKPQRIAVATVDPLPERLGKSFAVVDEGSADVLFGLRRLPAAPVVDCTTEVRYTGEFDRCEAVELAALEDVSGARTLAVLNALRKVPVAVTPGEPGPGARLLSAVRDWLDGRGLDAARRGGVAAAVDCGRLLAAAGAGVAVAETFTPADRAAGIQLLAAVAVVAADCLRSGQLVGPQDMDVLAVFGLGYPAWSGGPLRFLDAVRCGDIIDPPDVSGLPDGPFYAD